MFTCDWDISDIVTGTPSFSAGLYTSLHYDLQGNPHIAYYGNNLLGADNLFYTTYVGGGTGNCGPSNNWDCAMVDSGAGVGKYASLDLRYDDTVLIAYYREDLGDLKYAYFSGIGNCGSGNSWYCQTIEDGASDVGISASFIAPQYNGDIIRVAYYDKTNHKLRYAYSGLASGEGNCGPSDSWQCDDVDDMSAITPVGISLKLDPQGYPIIAYQYVEPDQQSS